MNGLTLTTFDWVPGFARGYVRDVRVRWALEEGGLSYRVDTVSFTRRSADHFLHQPFGQVPWLNDDGFEVFETGAILLYLGLRCDELMPADLQNRARVMQWMFVALNSLEAVSSPWIRLKLLGSAESSPEFKCIENGLRVRLERLDRVIGESEWLAGRFTVADVAMADVLRAVRRFEPLDKYPACRAYVDRATTRPAFIKAQKDHLADLSGFD